jgi:hypothetical protein
MHRSWGEFWVSEGAKAPIGDFFSGKTQLGIARTRIAHFGAQLAIAARAMPALLLPGAASARI